MKTVYFDRNYSYNAITISDEAYERLLVLAMQYRVCQKCSQLYIDDNPQVARNLCLHCFLAKENKRLTLVGTLPTDETDAVTYQFLDQKGYIYLSRSNSDTYAHSPVEHSIFDTLQYWHFPVPETYEVNKETKETVELASHNWYVYGDVQNKPVVVIEYRERYGIERYGNYLQRQFLAYKNGKIVELNRHKKAIREMYTEAKRRAEATKKGGYYHFDGHPYYQLFDADLYRIIADIASEEQTRDHV